MTSTETPPTRPIATLDEVARVAGVSRATVSRVVNGSPKVSPDVRRVVERAVDRLGYVPNRAARSLVTRRSDSVGVVVSESAARVFEDPFFPRVLRGISVELGASDLQLVLLMPDMTPGDGRLESYLAAGHVDGALLVSLHGDDPLPSRLAARGIPLVVGGRPPRGARVAYVDVDNRGGGHIATAHLVERGRRRIATIAGPADMAAGVDRLAGYRDALTEAGLPLEPALEARGDFTRESGAAAMTALLERAPDIDAVFAASDLMASGALGVLRAAGRGVPDDIAVVGFDDSPVARSTEPPLTSVRQPVEEMGREMARLLISGLGGRESVARHVILETDLVPRASSKGGASR